MQYRIVTVSNRVPREWYYLTQQFAESLHRFGEKAMNINYSHETAWNGLATKPKWLYRAIKEGAIPEEYMIFTDSWDLVFAAHPKKIMEEYATFGSDIVISAEKNCFPDTYKKEYDELDIPAPYSYLNSGFIVGKTEAILTCLEAMDLPNVKDDHWSSEKNCAIHSNDQTMWQKIFLDQPVKIALDYNQGLSQTLHDAKVEDFVIDEKGIMNKLTNCYPCSFHFNGGSKDDKPIRELILGHLNLL